MKRHRLLSSTTLHALAAISIVVPQAGPAAAQPAPSARPQGGTVVAGGASIGQTAAQTTVTQSTQRAAIDWRSFDIGANHTVAFQQPNTTSIALNRVTGPDPSQIAGHITANGQVALVNGSGVVFYKSAQVDAQSLVVSSANVTNQNFMAGKMAFDRPGRPDARIENAGRISVAATGLAALVAPQVANSGTITANMGHVILAGAEAHTVDLYGDGLMSVDVTRQVTQAPKGGVALVTNTGTITADGGTIVLTAQAADGIVQNLVSTRGRLQANAAGGKTGSILVSAIGGSIQIDGTAIAQGGGTIALAASDTVAVAGTARIAAGGGGTVAIGTTPARARQQPGQQPGQQLGPTAGQKTGGFPAGTARAVTVAAGARITADGGKTGSGGTIAILSTASTTVAGHISARGGRHGGNGGQVEISGQQALSVTATVDTRAPAGTTGLLTLDPTDAVIGGGVPDSQTPALQTIAASTFNGFTTNILVQADNSVTVNAPAALDPPLNTAFNVTLLANNPTGAVVVNGALTSAGIVTFTGGAMGGVTVNAPVTAAGVTVSANVVTLNNTLAAPAIALNANTLTLGTTAGIQAPGGTVAVAPLAAGSLTLGTGTGLALSLNTISVLTASAPSQLNIGSTAGTLGTATATTIALNTDIAVGAATLGLYASGDISQSAGALTVNTVTGATGGAFALTGQNSIQRLSNFASGGALALTTTTALNAPAVSGASVALQAAGDLTTSNATTAGTLTLTSGGAVNATAVTANTVAATAQTGLSVGGAFDIASSLSSATGSVAVTSTRALTLAGAARAQTTFDATAPALISTGDIYAVAAATLTANAGAVTQTAGTIASGTALTLNASAAITQGPGAVLAAQQDLTLTAGTDVQQAGTMLAGRNAVVQAGGTSIAGVAAAPLVTVNPVTAAGPFPAFPTPAGSVTVAATTPSLVQIDAAIIDVANPIAATAVTLRSTAGTTQRTAGTVTAGTLSGLAGYAVPGPFSGSTPGQSAVLTNPLNQIGTIGNYAATGDVRINSGRPLTVSGQVVAGAAGATIGLTAPALTIDGTGANTGSLQFGTLTAPGVAPVPIAATASVFNSIALQADSLQVLGSTTRIDSAGGLVAIAPLTPTVGISVDATHGNTPGTLSLAVQDLALINTLGDAAGPRTLQLGALNAATPLAASVTINAPLPLTNQAATLGLYATGPITEGPGGGISIGRAGATPIVGTLTGAAGGAVTLGSLTDVAPTNHFDVLGPFTSGGGLTLSTAPDANAGQSGLTVQGSVTAAGIGLLAVGQSGLGGTITIGSAGTAGTLAATGQTVTLVAQNGAAGAPAITETNGAIIAGTLTGQATTNDLSARRYDVTLTNAGNRIDGLARFIVGSVAPTGLVSAQGAFDLAGGPALTVTGPVTAKSVRITSSTLTINGDIGACAVAAGDGKVVLTSTIGPLDILGGTIGGQFARPGGFSVALSSPSIVSIYGQQTAGGPVRAVVNGDSVSVHGLLDLLGGALLTNRLTVDSAISLGGTAGPVRSLPNPLAASVLRAGTITQPGGPSIDDVSGDISTGGNLTLRLAGPSITGQIVAGGNITATAAGNLTQAGGTIAAGGSLSVTAAGLLQQSPGAAFEAAQALSLVAAGTGSATLAGTLAGRDIAIAETSADLTLAPAPLRGAAVIALPTLTFHCPGCDTLVPSVDAPVMAAPGANRPATLLASANSLTLGTIGADAITLYSQKNTSQIAGTSVTANTLAGAAGYGAPVSVVPPPTGVGTDGATVTLDQAGNNIGQVLGYQVRGNALTGAGLILADKPGMQTDSAGVQQTYTALTLSGIVRAGPASDPLTATAAGASGTDVTLAVDGNIALNGTLAGRIVTLGGPTPRAAAGLVTETGAIVAGTLTTGAGAVTDATLTTANQVAILARFEARGGNIGFRNSRDLTVAGTVSAVAGKVAITAQNGAAAAAATEPGRTAAGTLTIADNAAKITVTARNVGLSGTNILVYGQVGACSVGDAATGNLTLTTPGAITVFDPAVLAGQTSLTLAAARGVSVTGGLLNAPAVTVGTGLAIGGGQVVGNTVAVTGGLTMTGGSMVAGQLNAGAVGFGGGALSTGNDLTIQAGPSIGGSVTSGGNLTVNQAALSTARLVAGQNLTINAPGDFANQGGGVLAAGGAVTLQAGGVVSQDQVSATQAGGTLLISGAGTGTAALAGTVSAGPVQIVQTGADLTFNPTVLRGAATVAINAPAIVFHCPGCDTATPSATVTTIVQSGANRPATLLLDGAALHLGTVAADRVTVHATGSIDQSGPLTALTFTGTAGYAPMAGTLPVYTPPAAQTRMGGTYAVASPGAGTITLDQPGNTIATVSDVQARTGLTLVDRPGAQTDAQGVTQTPGGLTLTGLVRAGPSSDPLDASAAAATGADVALSVQGPLGINGILAGRIVTLVADAVTQAGTIVAGTLTTGTGAVGATALDGANQIGTLGPFASGPLTLTNSRNLTVTGPVTVAGDVTLTTQAGTGTAAVAEGQAAGALTGATITATGTATLNAATDIGITNLSAAVLTGTAGGTFAVAGAFDTAQSTVAGGRLTLTSSRALTLAGTSQAGAAGATIAAPSLVSSANLVSTGPVTLRSAGAITQTGGGIAAPLLLGSAGFAPIGTDAAGQPTYGTQGGTVQGVATLTGVNRIARLGDFAAPGGFTLTNTPGDAGFVVAGALTTGQGPVRITLSGSRPDLLIGDSATQGATINGGVVTLTTPGRVIEQAAARIVATTLAGQAASFALPGRNSIGQLGTIAAAQDLLFKTDGNLDLAGAIVAGAALNLDAGGAITQSGGGVTASTLTVNATQLDGRVGQNQVGTLNAIQAPGGIQFTNAGPLAVTGPLAAVRIVLAAPAITLNGGTIVTGGAAQQAGTLGTAPQTVAAGTPGLYLETGQSVTQTGTTTIGTGFGSSNSTARIDLTSGTGTVALANLNGPTTNLIFNLGNGTGRGAVSVRNLLVDYTGAAGGLTLTGSVAGQTGSAAAGSSTIAPYSNVKYSLNGCAIAAINCVVIRVQLVPVGNPLKELSLNFFRDGDDERDLLVPNVTEQGL